jgi:hypothetical protein
LKGFLEFDSIGIIWDGEDSIDRKVKNNDRDLSLIFRYGLKPAKFVIQITIPSISNYKNF